METKLQPYSSNVSTSIVDENDMLNKMILERCKNIVEGKMKPQSNSNSKNPMNSWL